jgi:hypothetical protein
MYTPPIIPWALWASHQRSTASCFSRRLGSNKSRSVQFWPLLVHSLRALPAVGTTFGLGGEYTQDNPLGGGQTAVLAGGSRPGRPASHDVLGAEGGRGCGTNIALLFVNRKTVGPKVAFPLSLTSYSLSHVWGCPEAVETRAAVDAGVCDGTCRRLSNLTTLWA